MNPLPYVRAALLCERVLTEKDDSLSLIRLLEKLQIDPVGDGPLRVRLSLLLMLIAGEVSPGVHTLLMQIEMPSGKMVGEQGRTIDFRNATREQSVNFVVDIDLLTEESGVHWFWFAFNDKSQVLTRTPLMVTRAKRGAPAEKKA